MKESNYIAVYPSECFLTQLLKTCEPIDGLNTAHFLCRCELALLGLLWQLKSGPRMFDKYVSYLGDGALL